jgi:hypothetical protein
MGPPLNMWSVVTETSLCGAHLFSNTTKLYITNAGLLDPACSTIIIIYAYLVHSADEFYT